MKKEDVGGFKLVKMAKMASKSSKTPLKSSKRLEAAGKFIKKPKNV